MTEPNLPPRPQSHGPTHHGDGYPSARFAHGHQDAVYAGFHPRHDGRDHHPMHGGFGPHRAESAAAGHSASPGWAHRHGTDDPGFPAGGNDAVGAPDRLFGSQFSVPDMNGMVADFDQHSPLIAQSHYRHVAPQAAAQGSIGPVEMQLAHDSTFLRRDPSGDAGFVRSDGVGDSGLAAGELVQGPTFLRRDPSGDAGFVRSDGVGDSGLAAGELVQGPTLPRRDPSGDAGFVQSQTVEDPVVVPARWTFDEGTTIDKFETDPITGEQLPKSGTTKDGSRITFDHRPDGSYTETVDGAYIKDVDRFGKPSSLTTFEVQNDPIRWTGFDEKGRQVDGVTKSGQRATMTHNDEDGTSRLTVGNNLIFDYENSVPTKLQQDGFIFDKFVDGHFRLGFDPDRKANFNIDYLDGGAVIWTYGPNDWVKFDAKNKIVASQNPGKWDGEVVDYSVEVPKMADTIQCTKQLRESISASLQYLNNQVVSAIDYWTGPSAQTYSEYAFVMKRAGEKLLSVLDEAIRRMMITYQNYVGAEEMNTTNLERVTLRP